MQARLIILLTTLALVTLASSNPAMAGRPGPAKATVARSAKLTNKLPRAIAKPLAKQLYNPKSGQWIGASYKAIYFSVKTKTIVVVKEDGVQVALHPVSGKEQGILLN